MQTKHLVAMLAVAALVAFGSSFAFIPDAHAATVHAVSHGSGFLADLPLHAAFGLVALRTQLGELETRAKAKFEEIKEGLTAEQVRAIEADHKGLLTEIEAKRGEIAAAEQAERNAPAPGDAAAAVRRSERERAATIRDIGRRAGMKAEDIDAAAGDDTTVEAFRTRAFNFMAERTEQVHTGAGVRAKITGVSDQEKRGAAMEVALLHRAAPAVYELTEQAREYRGMTLLEMGRDMLEAMGVRTRGTSKQELARMMLDVRVAQPSDYAVRAGGGFQTTADFPNVLANVANKTLRAGYEAAPQTFRPLVRETTLPDFKQVSRVQLGEAPQLEKVNEHGEFKRGKMGDSAERYALSTYGKVIAITRQVIINDDLAAFTRIPRAFGVSAANLESDLVWGQILANPTMGDNIALFHASHGNLASGGGIATVGVTGVDAGRKAMRNQKGIDGKTQLNIVPVYMMVPTTLETVTEQFLSPIYPAQTSNVVTPTMQKLKPIAEPRLDAVSTTAWYMAASPDQIDVVELAYLEGEKGLYTETRMGFDVDGVEVKVRQDVAAKVIDFRGLFKNPGQ